MRLRTKTILDKILLVTLPTKSTLALFILVWPSLGRLVCCQSPICQWARSRTLTTQAVAFWGRYERPTVAVARTFYGFIACRLIFHLQPVICDRTKVWWPGGITVGWADCLGLLLTVFPQPNSLLALIDPWRSAGQYSVTGRRGPPSSHNRTGQESVEHIM